MTSNKSAKTIGKVKVLASFSWKISPVSKLWIPFDQSQNIFGPLDCRISNKIKHFTWYFLKLQPKSKLEPKREPHQQIIIQLLYIRKEYFEINLQSLYLKVIFKSLSLVSVNSLFNTLVSENMLFSALLRSKGALDLWPMNVLVLFLLVNNCIKPTRDCTQAYIFMLRTMTWFPLGLSAFKR